MNMTLRTKQLIDTAIVWDNHGCMPLRADASFLPELERYRRAGVNVVSINIGYADYSRAEHLRVVRFMRNWIDKRSDAFLLIGNVDDI
jgi:membrane dipeptidase